MLIKNCVSNFRLLSLKKILLLCNLHQKTANGPLDGVIALVPYFGYIRQALLFYKGEPISASFFKIKVQNIDPTPLLTSIFKDFKDYIVVSPDKGSLARTRLLSNY